MTIVFSMAGLSSRFTKEGYNIPKYMLYIGNKSIFSLSVSGFNIYFKTFKFIFITLDIFETKQFVERECILLGIENYEIIVLNNVTKGQAETVYIGLKQINLKRETPLFIFNIDTFRNNFIIPNKINEWDGYLEVFKGEGTNWSFAKVDDVLLTKVVETAEKKQISNFCSTGLYYFKTFKLFEEAYNEYYLSGLKININEFYIAPMYNYLILKNKEIHINLIKTRDVVFCGTPLEYTKCLSNFVIKNEII